MMSIVIPAHNEVAVIERCLNGIVPGSLPGELEVIVVANGCTDGTAVLARRAGPPVRVLETPIASKSHALNLGDQAAQGFPRFYVDADVVVTIDAIRKVAAKLTEGPALAAAPRMRVNLAGRGWLIRAYYKIWTHLPYCTDAMIGSGFYALSADGRRRFTSFPNIISDDGYVRLLFAPGERVTVTGCEFEVVPPKTLRSLVRIKTRSQFDKYELHGRYPDLRSNERRAYWAALRDILAHPCLWPCAGVYGLVLGVARLRTVWRFLFRQTPRWDRDDSSREIPAPPVR